MERITRRKEVIMMGMHLLSNPTSAPNCVQREGQACVLSNYLDEIISSVEDKNSLNIILIGDMNDYDSSVLDSSNHLPTSRLVPLSSLIIIYYYLLLFIIIIIIIIYFYLFLFIFIIISIVIFIIIK